MCDRLDVAVCVQVFSNCYVLLQSFSVYGGTGDPPYCSVAVICMIQAHHKSQHKRGHVMLVTVYVYLA